MRAKRITLGFMSKKDAASNLSSMSKIPKQTKTKSNQIHPEQNARDRAAKMRKTSSAMKTTQKKIGKALNQSSAPGQTSSAGSSNPLARKMWPERKPEYWISNAMMKVFRRMNPVETISNVGW